MQGGRVEGYEAQVPSMMECGPLPGLQSVAFQGSNLIARVHAPDASASPDLQRSTIFAA